MITHILRTFPIGWLDVVILIYSNFTYLQEQALVYDMNCKILPFVIYFLTLLMGFVLCMLVCHAEFIFM